MPYTIEQTNYAFDAKTLQTLNFAMIGVRVDGDDTMFLYTLFEVAVVEGIRFSADASHLSALQTLYLVHELFEVGITKYTAKDGEERIVELVEMTCNDDTDTWEFDAVELSA